MAGYAPNSSHQDFLAPPQPTALDLPTNWALSTHEPDCQSCNILGMFLAIQSDIPFGHKRKLKRQALADSENEKRLPYYLLIYGPIHWQSKILPYYLIPLCNIFPLMSCARHGYKKKSHINNQTTSKIWHSTTSHKNNNLSGLLQAIKPLTQV